MLIKIYIVQKRENILIVCDGNYPPLLYFFTFRTRSLGFFNALMYMNCVLHGTPQTVMLAFLSFFD